MNRKYTITVLIQMIMLVAYGALLKQTQMGHTKVVWGHGGPAGWKMKAGIALQIPVTTETPQAVITLVISVTPVMTTMKMIKKRKLALAIEARAV